MQKANHIILHTIDPVEDIFGVFVQKRPFLFAEQAAHEHSNLRAQPQQRGDTHDARGNEVLVEVPYLTS